MKKILKEIVVAAAMVVLFVTAPRMTIHSFHDCMDEHDREVSARLNRWFGWLFKAACEL